MAPIDQVQLHFNPQTLQFLNAVLGLVMFGVALDLQVEDFRVALRTPKALALGLFGHHVLFPAMTYVLVWILQPQPSIALGMILVSSCPAGHISNFLVHFSRGNTALSVSVSALSTLAALVMTPLNFAFWGNLSPVTSGLMKQVAMSPWEMLQVVVLLLGVPLVLGMGVAHRYPGFAARIRKPMKWLSLLVLVGFIVGALAANFQHFLAYIQFVVLVVFIHNLLALATGYGLSTALGLPERDRRAITFEMGIQNSGLGLILIFNFFNGLGGMAIVTAWWGIWHIVAGMTLACTGNAATLAAPRQSRPKEPRHDGPPRTRHGGQRLPGPPGGRPPGRPDPGEPPGSGSWRTTSARPPSACRRGVRGGRHSRPARRRRPGRASHRHRGAPGFHRDARQGQPPRL
jgi:BASS family bile acid:Na+ symporter